MQEHENIQLVGSFFRFLIGQYRTKSFGSDWARCGRAKQLRLDRILLKYLHFAESCKEFTI